MSGHPICNLCGAALLAADAIRSPRLCPACRPATPGYCAACDSPLLSSEAYQTGFCAPCRDVLFAVSPGPERQAAAASERSRSDADVRDPLLLKANELAALIDGRPWCESSRDIYIASYDDLDLLNAETGLAEPFGWYIDSSTSIEGRHSPGAMAAGALLGGLAGMALASGKSPDGIAITWRREIGSDDEPSAPGAADPVATLHQLRQMLDEHLITADEYASKKRDIIDRM